MKNITIRDKEEEPREGIFLVNPKWIHLDEQEIKEKLEKGEKLFKVETDSLNL